MSRQQKLSEEETGRNIRYREFEEERIRRNADLIAVAHNMNDQAETIVMRICRGSGLTGLSGIRPVRGNIIRPLIDCFRSEIEEYLSDNNQPFRTDSTNFEEDYTRNRIRLKVIPYLAKEINSAAMENIARSASLLRQEDEFLNSMAERYLEELCVGRQKNSVSVDSKRLLLLDTVMQRRIIRAGLVSVCADIKDVSAGHIDSVLGIAARGGHCDMPSGFKADMSCGKLVLYHGESENIDFSYSLSMDRAVFVPECGLYFEMSKNPEKNVGKIKYLYTKVFDCDKISINPVVRNRKNGDRIITNNSGGSKKLKDIFIDRKIPKVERDLIPVISAGEEVMSVLGIKDSVRFLPDSRGGNNLYIRVWRKNDD